MLAGRQRRVSLELTRDRYCKPEELCWLATEFRPDICARLAQLAEKGNNCKWAICAAQQQHRNGKGAAATNYFEKKV